jgi:hypothetical protein
VHAVAVREEEEAAETLLRPLIQQRSAVGGRFHGEGGNRVTSIQRLRATNDPTASTPMTR